MQVDRKNLNKMNKDIIKELKNRKQGDVIVIPIAEDLFPNRLIPILEIVVLDPEDNFIAYRGKSNPDSKINQKGPWMIGNPATVSGAILCWAEKIIEMDKKSPFPKTP